MNTRWISENWDQIWQLTSHHAVLGVTPVLLSLLLSVPLGWWAHRARTARRILVPGASVLYALPSLHCSSFCRSSSERRSLIRSTSSSR